MTSIRDRIKGSLTALVTPFKNGRIDEDAYRALVDWQIAEGTQGLVPCGTTGESPTLSHEEHARVIELCVEQARGRVPVIAGAGSNSTDEAIMRTRHAKDVGCDAVLHVTGYYNKPNQEGQYRHFMAIAGAVDIPVILYNIPGRAVVGIAVETMARLAKHKNIIGVKDATADLNRPSRERLACGKANNKEWLLLSGEDGTALGYNAHGGVGCISVTANVAPRLCAEFQAACASGDYAKAREYQDRLMPLHDAMFCETNPGPVKYAVSLLGKCAEDMRLPMVPPADAARAQIKKAMQDVGLIN
ncbi:MAG: 4-hydroxy-tetrahydrodipicolinate synthase [Alphaproteobacteria bacterium]|nr:4-hydroxy-tetrahydrodipicolinate synthase [Alphaproteobacteria bacterium]